MMVRFVLVSGVLGALAACQPAVPDSAAGVVDPGRGVGFDNPSTLAAREAREAALESSAPVTTQSLPTATEQNTALQTGQLGTAQPEAVAAQSTSNTQPRALSDPQGLDAELAQIAAQNDAAAAAANSGQDVVNASPSNAAPPLLNNPGISDENDFGAVSSRQSIESDAARLQQNRQQYEVVQPTALPSRSGSRQPNIVQYALSTSHSVGTRVHRRVNLGSAAAKFQRNCAAYSSNDEAQIEFLAAGGPQRDRRGVDPDGDGYACGWDPAPFRSAASN